MTTSTKSPLVFNNDRHEYLLNGSPVPSVTRIISSVTDDMMLNSSFIRAGIRGTAVHKVCEMINEAATVNFEALSEDIRPYVNGYRAFVAKEPYTVVHSEMRVYSNKYRFAGTVDIIARNPKTGRLAIMDIKTTAVLSPTIALQLSGYEGCYREMYNVKVSEKIDRIAIWLTGDGGYQLQHYKDPTDWNTFLCHLAVTNWRRRNGL